METSSRDVFLGTTEILEQVFLQADMRTVLFAQGVCKKWHLLITTSPLIQHHLFFQPAIGSAPIVQNPLLAEMFPPFFHRPSNPPKRQKKPFTPEEVEALPLGQKDRNAAFMYEKATWRRMLICQPPVQSIIRLTITSFRGGQGSDFQKLTEEGNTRLQLPDIVKEVSQEATPCPPLRMESLFDWVTGGSGESNSWMFIWHDPRVEGPIPHEIKFHSIDVDKRRALEQSLKRDGLVMLETEVNQCTGPPGPWQFGPKFLVRGHWWEEASD